MNVRPGYFSEQIRNKSFEEILEVLSDKRGEVYKIISEKGPITTEEIAEILKVYPHCVSGRVVELRDDYGLIEYVGMKISSKNNRSHSLWMAKKLDNQINLF